MRLLRGLARVWTIVLGCTALALTLGLVTRAVAPRLGLAPAPSLASSDPADGASDVLPRSRVTLRFSQPMNRAAAAALQIEPPTAGTSEWSDDGQTLTFRPAMALAPAVTYTISLNTGALGRWWQPLAAPVALRFRTAPQPAVVAAMPQTGGAPLNGALAVVFSQPMVPVEQIGQPVTLPQFQFEPPIAVRARWADQHTLILHPETPLSPATQYRATIGANLADLRGVELGAPFSWNWSTGWPAVLERAPAPAARWVSPREPLALRLAAPLDLALLQRALRITPPIAGDFAADLVGATQVITFTPRGGWRFGTSYQVELVEPPDSGLGAPPALNWRFEVEPEPRLVAFFPGQGQLLPPNQDIRLVFSTPVEEAALRAGLRIEPPVGDLALSISETEVRLRPELQPSTLYTITIAADTRDRSGEPLGVTATVRLRTSPARPALAVPAAFDGLLTLPVSRTAVVELERHNLSALDLSLYPLDTPTLLRALSLGPNRWRSFNPERYGQALARRWQIGLGDPIDQLARSAVPVGLADGEPLAPGAYYLRVTTPEGPRADLLLLVSALRLALRPGTSEAVVWATDARSGTPAPNLPVALYDGNTLLARGQTGPDGVWVQSLTSSVPAARLLALAEGDRPALARGDRLLGVSPSAAPRYRSLAFTDRARYRPGAAVRLRGLTRQQDASGALTTPAPDARCRLQLQETSGQSLGSSADCGIEPLTGTLSGTLTLSPRLAPGAYQLAVEIGDEQLRLPLRVVENVAPLDVAVSVRPEGLQLRLERDGLPLAGTPISWSLGLEPLGAPPVPEGFVLAVPADEARTLAGEATSDETGQLLIALPERATSGAATRYWLRVRTLTAEQAIAGGEAEGVLVPSQPLVALRLPNQLLNTDQRSTVELFALDVLGQPAPGVAIAVEAAPLGANPGAPLLARRATSGPDGRASVQLVQLNPGAYSISASAGSTTSRTTLWVAGGRYSGWRNEPGAVWLVPDRERYQPGDVARLLVTSPYPQANLLLTVERGGLLSAELRALRAGQVITLPISADMAPVITVGALLAAGEEQRAGTVTLRVASGAPALQVAVTANQQDYALDTTASLVIATNDSSGPLAADLLVTVAPADSFGAERALQRFVAGPPLATVAVLPNGEAPPASSAVYSGESGYAAALDGGAGGPGLVAARVPLPAQAGRWRITVYAASGPERIAAGSTVVTTSQTLAYSVLAPPTLRAGDRAELTVQLRNTSPVTREVRASLGAGGVTLDAATPAAQRLLLAPGAAQRLVWAVVPQPDARQATLSLRIETPGLAETVRRELPVLASRTTAALPSTTIVGNGALSATLELSPTAEVALELALAPGLRAALAEAAETLAARPERSVEETASMALLSAGLARGANAERARWIALAQEALFALERAQNEDGGWGWWPDTPSRLFTSAYALEAIAAARAADGRPAQPSLRALAYLRGAAAEASPDTRAFVAYALAQVGRGNSQSAAALLDEPLAADGLAYLALALPSPASNSALARMLALAERQPAASPAVTRWLVEASGELPRNSTIATAAAAQALRALRPGAPELAAAERALLEAWGVEGWPSSYAAARVAAALLGPNEPAGAQPRSVTLNRNPLFNNGAPISQTVHAQLRLPASDAPPVVAVQASGEGTYLLAYRVAAPTATTTGRLAVEQELLDPASNTPLDPDGLRLGQLVALRVTAVVAGPLLRAELTIELPAGLEPLPIVASLPFQSVGASNGTLRLGAAELGPGVYTHTVLARAVAAGRYGAPPARLVAVYQPELAANAASGLFITINP